MLTGLAVHSPTGVVWPEEGYFIPGYFPGFPHPGLIGMDLSLPDWAHPKSSSTLWTPGGLPEALMEIALPVYVPFCPVLL